MNVCLHLKHAADIWSTTGPTGRFAEVFCGRVEDHGGNVLFEGTADQCVAQKWRIPVRLVPTDWVEIFSQEVTGADHFWQFVVEKN